MLIFTSDFDTWYLDTYTYDTDVVLLYSVSATLVK